MNWQQLLSQNLTTAEELRAPLNLTEGEYASIRAEIARFPMSVTRYYLSLIDPSDPLDPIRRMAIPSETCLSTDGELDTSGESGNTKRKGVQHKYRQTVLVLLTADCATFCRHCFRRRLVGKPTEEIAEDLPSVAAYIRAHPEVNNVLLSGGDAFLLPTERIEPWLSALSALPALDFIRFGTRTPVTFPQRILTDPTLLDLLSKYAQKKQLYVVTHFNHPREFTPESTAAIRALQKAGVAVRNQTVLLRGVNDDAQTLAALLQGITARGVTQHYVFQCRPVQGVKPIFQVPLKEGLSIVQAALAAQNGIGKADYTLSHVTGKIRVLGTTDAGETVFQYKTAKDPQNIGRIFTLPLDDSDTWLPDPLPI